MKIYQNPEFSVLSLASEDILTMSVSDANNIRDVFDFNDLISL